MVEEDRIGNPRADEVFKEKQARAMGLLWSRRKGAMKRAGITFTQRQEENEDEAIEAGQALRNHLREILTQVPNIPDRYNPAEHRSPRRQRHETTSNNNSDTRAKRQRIEMASDSDENHVKLPKHNQFSPILTSNFIEESDASIR